MGVPSAAIVYTGESGNMQGSGRGAAYSEGIGSTLDIIDKGLKDIRENEKLKKQEAMQKANAWNSLMEETPDVWNVDYESVNEKANAYTKYVTDLKYAGYDPFNLPSKEMRELTRLRNEVSKEATAAKANKEWWDKNTFNINEDAGKTWDQGYAAEWFKKYTDPSLTPSERAKLRQESNPYQKNVDLVDIVATIGKQMDDQKITKGGYDITQKSPEDFKKLISIYFADQGGMDDYEALMSRGKYKNDEELLNDATTIFKSLYQPSSVKRPSSGSTTKPKEQKEDKFKYGGKTWGDNLSVSAGKNANFDPNVTYNTIVVNKDQKPLPAIEVPTGDGGAVEHFQPVSFHMRSDKDPSGNKYISVLGNIYDEKGNVTGQKWLDYDAMKPYFTSQMEQFDVREQLRELNNPTSTGVGTTGTTETPAQRAVRIANGG